MVRSRPVVAISMVGAPSIEWLLTLPLWHFGAVYRWGVHPIAYARSDDRSQLGAVLPEGLEATLTDQPATITDQLAGAQRWPGGTEICRADAVTSVAGAARPPGPAAPRSQ